MKASGDLAGRAARLLAGTRGQVAFSVLAQLARFGAPLLYYPILVRLLSTEEFSAFVLCLATGLAIGQFTEFGFGLSAVRSLARCKVAPGPAALASGEVLVGKSLMLGVTTAVYLAACAVLIPGRPFVEVALPLLIGAAYGFTPNWYFIGIGRAGTLALWEILVSFGQLILILFVVEGGDSYVVPVYCVALPVLALAIFGQAAILHRLGWRVPTRRESLAAIRTAYHFFVSTNAPTLMNRALLLVLGATASSFQVACYAAAERIVAAGIATLQPVMRVLLPKMTTLYEDSRAAAHALFNRILRTGTGLYGAAAFALAVTAPYWVSLVFGPKLASGWSIMAAFLLVVPVSAAGRIVGLLFLMPARLEMPYHRITIVSCALGLLLAAPAGLIAGAFGMIFVRLGVEALNAGRCFAMMRRSRADEFKATVVAE